MESEARNQNNNYNEFFYATMCHVCKRFGDGVSLKICSKCRMISYCSQEHQKQHWEQHKPLCKAIRDVLQVYNMDYRGETTQKWVARKLGFIEKIASSLGRRLYTSEIEMFILPNECLVCHEQNFISLESCQKCATSFCKKHKDGTEHTNICGHLELRLRTNLLCLKKENNFSDLYSYLQDFLQEYSHISCKSTLQNMEDFVQDLREEIIQTNLEISHNILTAECSQYLTHPLTLVYAMRLLNDVPNSKDLVIHVIGATMKEVVSLIGWDLLPRITMVSVVVVLIGPKLSCALNPSHDCDNCSSREKKCLTFELHDMLYEKYARSLSFRKPDLVVGFNLCIHKQKFRGRASKTWAPCLKLIAKKNFPFVLTSSTLYAFEKETDIINTVLDKQVEYLYSGKNPFGSLSASRTMGVDYISFINQYVTVYRSLCS